MLVTTHPSAHSRSPSSLLGHWLRSAATRFPLSVLASSLFLLAALPFQATAQHEAFDGTWRIDLERSDSINREGLKIDNSYTLATRGENLQVTRTLNGGVGSRSVDWVFITDGKPNEIPGLREPRQARTRWKKDRLNVSYTLKWPTPRGSIDLDITEVWKINDRSELEIQTNTRAPDRNLVRTEIYVRVESLEGSL